LFASLKIFLNLTEKLLKRLILSLLLLLPTVGMSATIFTTKVVTKAICTKKTGYVIETNGQSVLSQKLYSYDIESSFNLRGVKYPNTLNVWGVWDPPGNSVTTTGTQFGYKINFLSGRLHFPYDLIISDGNYPSNKGLTYPGDTGQGYLVGPGSDKVKNVISAVNYPAGIGMNLSHTAVPIAASPSSANATGHVFYNTFYGRVKNSSINWGLNFAWNTILKKGTLTLIGHRDDLTFQSEFGMIDYDYYMVMSCVPQPL
jgi:hypothetical protein